MPRKLPNFLVYPEALYLVLSVVFLALPNLYLQSSTYLLLGFAQAMACTIACSRASSWFLHLETHQCSVQLRRGTRGSVVTRPIYRHVFEH